MHRTPPAGSREIARDHETVAAVVPRPAEDDRFGRVALSILVKNELGATVSGALHQFEPRADAVDRFRVDLLHLLCC